MDTEVPRPSNQHVPAMFNHCVNVYAEMTKQSEIEIQREHVDGLRIYTGMGTRLFQQLGLGNPYYTAVMRRLLDMDCIRQITRGGGGQPSKWLLLREPTLELWEQFPEGTRGRYGKTATRPQVPEQQVKDLHVRVGELETEVRNLKAVVYAKSE